MRNLILFGLLVVLLVAAQFTSAKTVDDVIDKYIKARGGKNKLTSVKSIYMEGTKEIMGEEAGIKIIKEQDKLSRTDIENEIANSFILITEKMACTFFSYSSPAIENINMADLAALQTEADIAGPLVNYIAKGHKAELLGKEMVEGNTCYKIRLTTSAGKEMMFWLDASTYLLTQSSAASIGYSGDTGKETFTIYRNYKKVDGINFAHACEIKLAGTNRGIGEELSFHTIILNPVIDPAMYLPESII